jgi:hypothetical protein
VKTPLHQKIVLLCIEKLAVTESVVIDKIVYILNTLYEADILEEGLCVCVLCFSSLLFSSLFSLFSLLCSDKIILIRYSLHVCVCCIVCVSLHTEIILKWFEHPSKKLDASISKQLREKATPFINWLKNAEEESD